MKKPNYDFIFSSDVSDWMSSEEKREHKREQHRISDLKKKEKRAQRKNIGMGRLQFMNDQLRQR